MKSLTWKIANALLNAKLIKDDVSTILLEDVIAKEMPVIDKKSKKKVHFLDPRGTPTPVCGEGRNKQPQITPDKSLVTCRRCRMTYLFDEELAQK